MSRYVPLPGSKRSLLPDSRPAGPVDLSLLQSLTIRVRSREDVAKLEEMVYKQSSQPLKDRIYLTREQLAQQHGAKAADLDLVEQYAQRHNLAIAHRSAAERSIVLSGKLGDLLSAFPANVQIYHHPDGTYRGRQGEISIPEGLDKIVTGVFGFDTRPRQRSRHRHQILAASGPGGDKGVAATEYAKRYNFPTEFEGKTLDGTGQTIALIELGGGYRYSDLQVFFQEIGVPMPNIVAVPVDNAANNPSTPGPFDSEVMMDLEVAGAVAPKAQFVVYFAPNGDKGLMDAISKAVHDTERKPDVISISWGSSENANDQQGTDAYHELFVAAASVGITVCAATGDYGAANMPYRGRDNGIHVNHPASDYSVLACGGTQISNGEDVVWNTGQPLSENSAATGGGISVLFQPPPPYQDSVQIPVSLASGKSGRGVPDIAMCAINYFTRVDSSESAAGGTSAVTPLMAALVVRLNQAKQKNVAFLNPFLYANADRGIFHDVTSGTNALGDGANGYQAGPGWDACTGLGTPDGTAILNNL
jgi:kumamolisin